MKKLFILFLTYNFCANIKAQSPITPSNIVIARDAWGVPHIFGKTDAEAAYGLAWANSEDAFEIVQEDLLIAKSMMGRYKGKEGAAFDFFVHAIAAKPTVQAYLKTIPPDFLRYLEGYCQGVNDYAKAHPKEVKMNKLFPVTPQDVLQAYLISFAALSGSVGKIEDIMGGRYDKNTPAWALGSNAYAFSSQKNTEGKTYLCINPHFLIEGAFSFYEAHLQSDEGLNITGALFHGGASIFLGNNNHLGWGQTYNYIDQVDVFELKMHKTKKLYYELDSQYVKLEKRPVWLKVRLGSITIPVKKMTYWSKYGVTLRSPDGRFFAVRSPSFFNAKAAEQYYRMNKATNFKEFKTALNMNGLTMFNIVYADKEDNIFYISNGLLPKRNPKYDYSGIVTGTTTQSLWTEYYTTSELPQVENPYCGYVFNTNNTPSNATCSNENFPKEKVDKYIDLRAGNNNRATRFMEMLQDKEKFSFEEFKAMKFDTKLSKNTHFYKTLGGLFAIDADKYPHLEEAIKSIQKWDGDGHLESTQATLFMLSMEYIFKKKGYGDEVFISGLNDVSEDLYIEGIEHACTFLNKYHNSIHVPLGQVQSHFRGGKLHKAGGFPDVLSPAYSSDFKEGKYKMNYGDTYIHFVKFNRKGAEIIETLLPFENTKTCENYQDELDMFNHRELKTMSLDKAYILKTAKKIYSPK